jgi:D-aspartate ligase
LDPGNIKGVIMDQPFVPLLFASDINVYSVARAFNEKYGVISQVYGKSLSGPCTNSAIINYTHSAYADKADILTDLVNDFARRNKEKKVLLIGCGDSYVRQVSACKGSFLGNVVTACSDLQLIDKLIHKERFYELCKSAGLDIPETFIHRKEMGEAFTLPFEGPFIVKPSGGIEYWEHSFSGQDKVFKLQDIHGVTNILKRIYDSGYSDSVVIQNFIPGDDTYMRVLTNYSDKNGKVQMACMGHVLLEEHTPHGLGNHAVIISRSDEETESKIRTLLEGVGYRGFSNFDFKFDRRDEKCKVFELNARQGRSNYYVTAAGENIAEYLVDDLIYNKEKEFKSVNNQFLWMVVPKKVAFDYISQDSYRKEMKSLIKEGRYANPLIYGKDTGLKRGLRVKKNLLSHFQKYRKYYGKSHE